MDDKSLHVQVASITDSSEKKANYVEGGSMKDNETLMFHVGVIEHGGITSSISSQGCHDANDDGKAPKFENVGSS